MLFCVPHSYDCIDKRIVVMEKKEHKQAEKFIKKN